MRRYVRLIPLAAVMLAVACNTVHGVGEDARSVGRVFTNHPDGPAPKDH
jgi:predicted small secreted protein